MNDQDQPVPGDPAFGDPAFDDPAFDDLRALLADARVTEPVPDEVVARLDATLSSLRDQRRADSTRPTGSVLVLRRRVGRALVAAAAVAAVAAGTFGIVHGAHEGSGSDSAASGAAQDAEKSVPPAAPGVRSPGLTSLAVKAAGLHKAHFARDAARLMRTLSATEAVSGSVAGNGTVVPTPSDELDTRKDYAQSLVPASAAPPVTATPAPLAGLQNNTESGAVDGHTPTACTGPDAPGAVTLAATLDGVPVALVFRPPTASSQVVEAWSCDGASLLASATVPH